ncbi:uncharacterized protein J4E84_006538 [Alternaria hordeiaustralica]|uniref:uncharacterized protein n=1 Tax=Alternaria hordeiaustralica TaxID=1187925 RepID=UPI0020C26F8B|nr:uncharacterized protein J4E84_006538 [Alternaria hordeiaustralica]KAI4684548.1 hypothetical protein J4E84_006538 [Alternaria hordeiaustralica]
MTMFNSLGLEQVQQSHAHASQDCTICRHPLALHPTKSKPAESKLHRAVRIAACGHIVGQQCLDAWLEVGNTCPTCKRLLFEPTGGPITQQDINNILRTLGPQYGEDAIMAVVARRVARQEYEHARMRQAHEIELERMKAEETEARNDAFTLSNDDLLDSDEDMDFEEDEEDDDEAFEAEEDGSDSS